MSRITNEHQLTSPYLSAAQKKVFGRAKRAEARVSTKSARKAPAKKSAPKTVAKKAAKRSGAKKVATETAAASE